MTKELLKKESAKDDNPKLDRESDSPGKGDGLGSSLEEIKWWQSNMPDAKGLYRFNPALIGGFIGSTIIAIINYISHFLLQN